MHLFNNKILENVIGVREVIILRNPALNNHIRSAYRKIYDNNQNLI